jgi:hypothetical protein
MFPPSLPSDAHWNPFGSTTRSLHSATVKIGAHEYEASLSPDGTVNIVLTEADTVKYRTAAGEIKIILENQNKISFSIATERLGSGNFIVETDFGTLTVPNEALKAMQRIFSDMPVRLSITKGSFNIALLDSQGRAVIYNNREHPMTLTLPYVLGEDEIGASVVAVSGSAPVIFGVYRNGGITFDITRTGMYNIIYNPAEFPDAEDHWAEDYIAFMASRGLAGQINSEGEFGAEMLVTRAMFAQLFARLENADLSEYNTPSFSDVSARSSSFRAIEWAADNEIVEGVGGGRFAPNRLVTREEMAVMLDRYIKYKGREVNKVNEKIKFNDEAEISDWAKEAVSDIQQTGIIVGKRGNIFDPQGITTRAEFAAIFTRLIEAYSK